ncbi:MAG: HRDC domain-containing protein [Thermodesulfobacteriota bacterium]
MIDSKKGLQELVDRALEVDAVALDTEFVWERTYYPRLGLIQIALSDEDCYLIDPCSISDLSPLGRLLESDRVIKILHDAPQDLAILRQATGADAKNIFDTRLAAGFAGFTATISLAKLLQELLDINLAKTETRTNWLRRPLKRKQELYAMDDVRYLRAARVLLLGHMVNNEVRGWLAEDLQRLDDPNFYAGISDDKRYLKVKGNTSLSRESLAILQDLCRWREKEARERNRPRGHIIADRVLLPIAREKLTDRTAIVNSGPISEKCVSRYGATLKNLVEKGLARPKDELPPSLRNKRLKNREKITLQEIHEFIILKSDVLGIDPIVVGSNAELREFILTPPHKQRLPIVNKFSGWRGPFLLEILSSLDNRSTKKTAAA